MSHCRELQAAALANDFCVFIHFPHPTNFPAPGAKELVAFPLFASDFMMATIGSEQQAEAARSGLERLEEIERSICWLDDWIRQNMPDLAVKLNIT